MKVLMIWMSENMHSHRLHSQVHKIYHDNSLEEVLQCEEIGAYKTHFRFKKTGKVQIIVLDVHDETGTITTIFNDVLAHPIKEKIVINPAAKRNTKSLTTPVELMNFDVPSWASLDSSLNPAS